MLIDKRFWKYLCLGWAWGFCSAVGLQLGNEGLPFSAGTLISTRSGRRTANSSHGVFMTKSPQAFVQSAPFSSRVCGWRRGRGNVDTLQQTWEEGLWPYPLGIWGGFAPCFGIPAGVPFPSCSIEEQGLYTPEHRATVFSAVTCSRWAGGIH